MTGLSWLANETTVDSWQLRRHTVRINHPEGRLLGSGFFVAPGWVMTAAHVVYDLARDAELAVVSVTPSDQDVGTSAVDGEVVVRSAPGTGTGVWPFPDIALVRLRPDREWVGQHPCVWLDDRHPVGTCHAYGFPVREPGVTPSGGPATFGFEGVTSDRYLQLKAGQAAPGLSGAPLVCPVQRGVVGVVVSSRDVYSDLGGLATPIAALLGDLPEVPQDLAETFREVRELGMAAVLADRASWHRVLAMPAAETSLAPPLGRFQRKARSLPAEMLLADSGVVPYLFRDRELEEAQRWCEQASAMEVWRFTGPGGAGKTRHAIELCKIMRGRGWLAGIWDGPAAAADTGFDVADVPLPRLVVVDYVEAFAAGALRVLLGRLQAGASELAPVRVLLLTRTAAGDTDVLREIGRAAGVQLRNVLNDAPAPVEVRGIPAGQRRQLYEEAVVAFRAAWSAEPPPPAIPQVDLSGERYAVPLEVLLEAFDHALSGGAQDTARMPVERALDHEEHYWSLAAPAELTDQERRAAVALATLAGADTDARGEALLRVLPVFAGDDAVALRRRTVRWLRGLYAGSARINPLRPDRLGEALVATTLEQQDDGGPALLRAVLGLPDDAQVSRSLDLLARLAATDATSAGRIAGALFDCHTDLVDRAEREARGVAGRPGRLDIAIGLQRLLASELAGRLEELARRSPHSADALFDLAMSYNRIGDLARKSGRSDRAEALYSRGFVIRIRMAAADRGNLRVARELSISYNRLGDLAHRSSKTPKARRLYSRSLQICERLVQAEPGDPDHARALATTCDRLADVAAEKGPREQAEKLYRRGLQIRERLARLQRHDPAIARELSVSYDKLGDLATEDRRAQEAKRLYERGLAIRVKLMQAAPDDVNVARDLSNSYDRLGDLAVDAKASAEGKARYEEALRIRQRLADAQPGNTTFARDLSRSFNSLGTIASDDGRLSEARHLYEEGLEIVERLIRAEPRNTMLARDRSVFLTNLGDVALYDGRLDDAEALYKQGLDGAQRLLAVEPENTTFARDTANFYERLGGLLRERSDPPARAEVLLSAGVQSRRRLHEGDRERGDLAEELAYALLQLADTIDGPVAQRLTGEAEELLQSYDQEGKLTGKGKELLQQARRQRTNE